MGDDVRRWVSLTSMAASGFAGLAYQIVWTEQSALFLGHEASAVLAVVAAFFGGLTVGASVLGPRIEKSLRPVRWYAGCELVIALHASLLIVAMPTFSAVLLRLTGPEPAPIRQWAVAFCGTFLILLPATAAMGGTLPAMARITARSIAALYAANTFGAVLGVLAAAFWLVPALGLVRTAGACALLGLFCAATSLLVFPATIEVEPPASNPRPRREALWVSLAATGLLGVGYEVLVVRLLGQVTEDTVYTYAMLLAVYLAGTAAGAAIYERWLSLRWTEEALGEALPAVLGAACLAGTATLWFAEQSKAFVLDALGNGVGSAIAAEAAPALLAFGPATVAMGALFCLLGNRASAEGMGFGRALAVNTLGAAVAPVLFGVLLVPATGLKAALLLVTAGYLVLVVRAAWFRPLFWVPTGAAVALWLLAPPLAFVDVPDGGRIVSYRDGVTASVSVVEDSSGIARLRIDNRAQEGSSATGRVDSRQAWLPLLLHAAPRRALFLGLGTGVTASSAAEDPTLAVDAVELLPEVVAAASFFEERLASGSSSRLRTVTADARRYVRTSAKSYDVIVSDNFHPARSGSGSLYTVEHFEAVRERLEPGGVFCQWLPLHQLDRETLRSIVRSFLAAYPEGRAMIASNSLETPVLGLVGRRDGGRFDTAALHERLTHVTLAKRIAEIGFEDDFAVLGSFVAGSDALERLSAGAPANTDDRPIVAYRAPRVTYAPESSPRDRFIALVRELSIAPGELILPAPEEWQSRLIAYWEARNRFIESGRDVRPSSRVEDMLTQVRAPLLSVLRISPDFRPAYDPLLAMASALARTDISGARQLLSEMTRLSPARAEAMQALAGLDGAASKPR